MPYQCQKCQKEILFLKHHETMKSNPVEAAPHPEGNLVIDRTRGVYRFATIAEKVKARNENKNLYISHFARCAFAKSFRKQK